MHPEESRPSSRAPVAYVSALAIIVFLAGYLIGARGYLTEKIPTDVLSVVGANVPPQGVDLSPVWKAWSVIDDKFVPAAIATSTEQATTTERINEKRVWGMISGLAASLEDPYTFFLPPVENKLFAEDMSGQFEGVGMEIAVKDQILTVVSPLKGTPAERAGVKSGDRILKIDGVETRGLDISDAVKKIRGPRGTEVTLTMLREGWDSTREIKVTREAINVPILESELRSDGIYVITLASFTSNSPDLYRNALRQFVTSGSDKLILDLRGNPGGYLEAAVDMASWYLPSGAIIVTEDYAGNSDNIVHRSRGYDIFTDKLKMVILINRGSASASEILAGALRSHGVAKLVGEPTFGKGSVQELVDITADTSLKITVARWLMPDGQQIPITGIVPDVEVKRTEEDIKTEKDPQMEQAIELLKSM